MEPGLYLLGSGINQLFDATDPDSLAMCHPAWEKDIKSFSPWSLTEADANSNAGPLRIWCSGTASAESSILVCGRCASTMDCVRQLTDICGLSPWDCLMAAEQQKGRGQMERAWISPPGNLYVSWYWPELESIAGARPGWQAMASLLAGDLVASALESFGVDIRIKWPNDLLADGHKVCGILVESRGGRLVVGIGVNLASAPPRERLTDQFALPAASLSDLGFDITPLELFLRLAQAGRKRLEHQVSTLAPEEFVMQLQKRLAWLGRQVTIRRGTKEAVLGQLRGISADGGLIVRISGKTNVIYTGSILPKENIDT